MSTILKCRRHLSATSSGMVIVWLACLRSVLSAQVFLLWRILTTVYFLATSNFYIFIGCLAWQECRCHSSNILLLFMFIHLCVHNRRIPDHGNFKYPMNELFHIDEICWTYIGVNWCSRLFSVLGGKNSPTITYLVVLLCSPDILATHFCW